MTLFEFLQKLLEVPMEVILILAVLLKVKLGDYLVSPVKSCINLVLAPACDSMKQKISTFFQESVKAVVYWLQHE